MTSEICQIFVEKKLKKTFSNTRNLDSPTTIKMAQTFHKQTQSLPKKIISKDSKKFFCCEIKISNKKYFEKKFFLREIYLGFHLIIGKKIFF